MFEKRDEFEKLYGESVLEEICEHIYGNKSGRVNIDREDKVDVLNKDVWGSIDLDNKTIYFAISDGNNNGTVVNSFSEAPISVPSSREVTVIRLAPKAKYRDNERSLKIFKLWQKQDWFKELERSVSYDKYVTGSVPDYWIEKLDQKGLTYRTETILTD